MVICEWVCRIYWKFNLVILFIKVYFNIVLSVVVNNRLMRVIVNYCLIIVRNRLGEVVYVLDNNLVFVYGFGKGSVLFNCLF